MARVELDSATLRSLQLVELELLDELDRICAKWGIRYCIVAGTMLGAARHGGFIPWDDDLDVAMMRPDYERFRAVCESELDGSRFLFQDHRATPGYRWGYGKLRRAGTLFLREHQEDMPYHQGVFVDVFPMDPVPESRVGRAVVNAACFAVRKLLWAPVGARTASSPVLRAWYGLLARVPLEASTRMLDSLVRRMQMRGAQSRWVRNLMFPTPNGEYAYLRDWYENPKPALFEGREYPGVSDAQAYLSFKFGDWRSLPPAGDRKQHPVSAIDLGGLEAVR